MSVENKLNYLVKKLKESGNKLPDSEILLIASQLIQVCKRENKSIYDLEII